MYLTERPMAVRCLLCSLEHACPVRWADRRDHIASVYVRCRLCQWSHECLGDYQLWPAIGRRVGVFDVIRMPRRPDKVGYYSPYLSARMEVVLKYLREFLDYETDTKVVLRALVQAVGLSDEHVRQALALLLRQGLLTGSAQTRQYRLSRSLRFHQPYVFGVPLPSALRSRESAKVRIWNVLRTRLDAETDTLVSFAALAREVGCCTERARGIIYGLLRHGWIVEGARKGQHWTYRLGHARLAHEQAYRPHLGQPRRVPAEVG